MGYPQAPVGGGYPQQLYYAPAGQPTAAVAGYPGQAPQPVYYAPQPGVTAEQPPPKAHHHKAQHGAAAPAGAPAPAAAAAEAGGGSSYTEQMEKAVRMGFVRKVYAVLAVQVRVRGGWLGAGFRLRGRSLAHDARVATPS